MAKKGTNDVKSKLEALLRKRGYHRDDRPDHREWKGQQSPLRLPDGHILSDSAK